MTKMRKKSWRAIALVFGLVLVAIGPYTFRYAYTHPVSMAKVLFDVPLKAGEYTVIHVRAKDTKLYTIQAVIELPPGTERDWQFGECNPSRKVTDHLCDQLSAITWSLAIVDDSGRKPGDASTNVPYSYTVVGDELWTDVGGFAISSGAHWTITAHFVEREHSSHAIRLRAAEVLPGIGDAAYKGLALWGLLMLLGVFPFFAGFVLILIARPWSLWRRAFE